LRFACLVGLAAFETTRQLRRPYGRAIEDAFGFAFVPELDRRGKDAAPGSALRQAYDAMVEAERERDDRHPPGTWIG
jgi:hypothetical protein